MAGARTESGGKAVKSLADQSKTIGDATRSIAFTIGVIVLGAKMAKVDGVVTRDEIAAFREVFRVPPEEVKNVGRIFNQARRDARGFEPYARQLGRMFRDRPQVLEQLMRGLFHIARADGASTAPASATHDASAMAFAPTRAGMASTPRFSSPSRAFSI